MRGRAIPSNVPRTGKKKKGKTLGVDFEESREDALNEKFDIKQEWLTTLCSITRQSNAGVCVAWRTATELRL